MKESEVRGSKRREGDERRGEAELAESGFAVERSRLRISGRPKGENPQTDDYFLVFGWVIFEENLCFGRRKKRYLVMRD